MPTGTSFVVRAMVGHGGAVAPTTQPDFGARAHAGMGTGAAARRGRGLKRPALALGSRPGLVDVVPPPTKIRLPTRNQMSDEERGRRFAARLAQTFGEHVVYMGPRAVWCVPCNKRVALGDRFGISNIRVHFRRRHPGPNGNEMWD